MNESVLDHPKEDLDLTVWAKNNNSYTLTDEATNKIESVTQWVIEKTGISNFKLHITGSITSNQYSDQSDVDLHYCINELKDDEPHKIDELNKNIREQFNRDYDEELKYIGTHKLEIYFQSNEFQDLMSIGCYDFFKKEWLVGPEMLPLDYDPYSEYYNKDMQYINSIIDDIRNVILEVFETLIVLNNSKNQEFVAYEYNTLRDKLAKAANIFTQAKEFRKVYSSPTSREDALKKRSSEEWKIADSAFKLMDKFGYLGILCKMSKAWKDISSNEKTIQEIIPNLINVITKNIVSNPNLQNIDRELFENLQTEGLLQNLAIITTIVSMISIPGITNASQLKKEMKNIPVQNFNIKDPMVTKAMNDSSQKHEKYGDLSYTNLVNMIATIAYNEGMLDYIKPNARGDRFDDRILQAIIWTIINRAGGNPSKFAEKILEKNQYYSAKFVTGNNDSNYRFYHPGVGYSKKTWDKCNEFAIQAIEGTLAQPKDDNGVLFGKRNMIANKAIDNPNSYRKWGKKCDFTLGGSTKHWYGYDKYHDGYSQVAKKQTYTIQSGDTLIQIAKKFNTTPKEIMEKNPTIKKPNQIFIGKIINV